MAWHCAAWVAHGMGGAWHGWGMAWTAHGVEGRMAWQMHGCISMDLTWHGLGMALELNGMGNFLHGLAWTAISMGMPWIAWRGMAWHGGHPCGNPADTPVQTVINR